MDHSRLLSEWVIPLFGRSRLVLAGGVVGLFALVAGGLGIVLLCALYRYERRLTSRGTGLGLLTLRLLAALVLVFALLDPVSEHRYGEAIRGRIVLGVDASLSMNATDPPASPEEKEVPTTTDSRRVRVARLLESPWLKRLQNVGDVETVAFARGMLAEGSAGLLIELMRTIPKPDDPRFQASDWDSVLDRALRARARVPAVDVVLLTDGRRNGAVNSNHEQLDERLREQGIRVHSLIIGFERPMRDAAVAEIATSERVLLGDSIDLTATIKLAAEVPGAEVPVRLLRDGEAIQEKSARARSDATSPKVTFHLPAKQVGYEALTVAVGPMAGDVFPDNDKRTVTVEVVDEKVRILLVDGEARWEFQYLHNALARDPHVTLEAVVFRQPAADDLSERYKRDLPASTSGEPDSLHEFDVIILGDLAAGDLDEESWTRIARYVDARGGTLVWSAGPRLPELVAAQRASRQLIPITAPAQVPFDQDTPRPGKESLPAGLVIVPAADDTSDAWPMLRFEDDAASNRTAWNDLPPQPFVIAGKAKPGATVLANATAGAAKPVPALLVMPYGLGRVFWIGYNGTWRWRHRAGDKRHHRFWGQLVRWAAGEKLVAGNAIVRFGPSRRQTPSGEPVAVRARFTSETMLPANSGLVAARIFRAQIRKGSDALESVGDAIAVVPLRPSPQQPRLYEAAAPALDVGRYLVRLEVPQLADVPTDAALLEIADEEGSEQVELTASRQHVERLATATGGKVFAESQAAAIVDAIEPRAQKVTRSKTTTLWDRPAALIVFLTLLTLEWILRKRAGLP